MFLSSISKQIKIFGIIIISFISNIGISQTIRDEIVKTSEYINKDKLLNIFVQRTSHYSSNLYLPIFINSNNKIDKIIIGSNDLLAFYEKKSKKRFLDMKLQEEYQVLVKNLILNKDTLEIDSTFFSNEYNSKVTIYLVPKDHYIYHIPDSAKTQIIKSYFNVDGAFIDDSIHIFAPLIKIMFDWYFFMEQSYPYEGEKIGLFDYKKYYETNNLVELIHNSLKLFIEQNEINEPVNILDWTFPLNILISFNKIGIEGKKLGLIQAKDRNVKNVKAISLKGILINDNIITIVLLYSKYDYSEEKDNVINYQLIESEFLYKYIEEDQNWKLIDQNQTDFKYN